MPQNNYNQSLQQFKQFRDKLDQSFDYRQDTVMDLVDAIAANTTARSPVELSLSSLFRRGYSALYKGIQEMSLRSQSNSTETETSQKPPIEARTEAIAELIPTPKQKQFYLWAIDVTPLPRPYAKTLLERKIIYQPNTIKGNKPINIGHSYSVLTSLPEREETGDMSWAIPLTVKRIKSDQTGKQVGSQQLKQILNNENLPWSNHLSVVVVDSDYSSKTFLAEQEQHTNLVVVTRVRSNRVFYTCPEPKAKTSVGHPQWYGTKFDLKNEITWHEPNQVVKENLATSRGRLLNVTIRSWSEMLMRGSHDCSMHRQPFSLIQIQVTTTEGMRIWKPMWLIMIGQRRHELSIAQAYQAYRQRYDLEHLLRFGKQKLLLNAIATPEVKHKAKKRKSQNHHHQLQSNRLEIVS
jgi:DDE superfamily endonuclease